jgi:hypothetical protein
MPGISALERLIVPTLALPMFSAPNMCVIDHEEAVLVYGTVMNEIAIFLISDS